MFSLFKKKEKKSMQITVNEGADIQIMNGKLIININSDLEKILNSVEHTTNLFSMDGLDEYGTCRDKVGLLDIGQYRKYRKVFGKNMDGWWWLLTPNLVDSVCSVCWRRW